MRDIGERAVSALFNCLYAIPVVVSAFAGIAVAVEMFYIPHPDTMDTLQEVYQRA